MSTRAVILKRLYNAGKVKVSGLRKAVADGTITAEEFEQITGEAYETTE